MPPRSSLRRTIFSLYGVQLATYLIPLVTLPWLTRTLGAEEFGRLMFCTAVNSYFVLLADYGFNFSATRQIALHSHSRDERSAIFWNTIATKCVLAFIGFAVLVPLTFLVDRLAADRTPLLLGYGVVIGTVLTPAWYFQGMERQPLLSTLTILTRALSVPAILFFVRSPADLNSAIAISACVPVVCGLACLGLLMSEKSLSRSFPTPALLLASLRDGWHIFLSTASISLYTSTSTVLLGFLSGNTAVGHYGAAERLYQAAQGMLAPINQSLYPRISRLMGENRDQAFALIRKLLRLQGLAALALSVLLFVGAPYAIALLYGSGYHDSVAILRWLAALPFFIGVSNVLGIHTMLPLGMNKTFSRILLAAGLLNVVLLYVLASIFAAVGAAISVLVTEVFVTLVMAQILRRRGVPIFSRKIPNDVG